MSDFGHEHLSRRERQIMDVIFAMGEATAAEVQTRIPDAPTKTAVRTLLGILEAKGHVKHRVDGKAYVYRPARPRTQAARSALRRVLRTFFAGSLEKAVAAHLADSTADLDDAELARLAELIRRARQKGR